MESEMQRAGRRALQAKGTAGAKALRQDSTGQTRQNSKGSWSWWGGGEEGGRGIEAGRGRTSSAFWTWPLCQGSCRTLSREEG